MPDMKWIAAEDARPKDGEMYVVKTNGADWSDCDLFIWPAPLLRAYMKPEIVRGRPLFVALVTNPNS